MNQNDKNYINAENRYLFHDDYCKLTNPCDEMMDILLNQRENIFESTVHRNADECCLKYVKIYTKFNYKNQEDLFRKEQKKSILELKLGGETFLQCDFDLLFELSNVKYYDNLVVIELPDFLSTKIPLTSMKLHDMKIVMSLNVDQISSVYCKCNYTYHDREFRKKLIENKVEIFTQSVLYETNSCTTWKNISTFKTTFNLDVSNKNITKGYFIFGDIDSISSLQITVSGIEMFSKYDKSDIDMLCDRITDNLLFLPYSHQTKLSYKNNSESSYSNSLLTDRPIKMYVTYNNDIVDYTDKTIKIYPLIGLYVRFESGTALVKRC